MESVWKLKFVMPNATAFAQVTVNGPYPLAEHLASFNMEFCVKMDRVCDLKKEERVIDERVVRKFLLLPRILEGKFRWLRYVNIREVLCHLPVMGGCPGQMFWKWSEVSFED